MIELNAIYKKKKEYRRILLKENLLQQKNEKQQKNNQHSRFTLSQPSLKSEYYCTFPYMFYGDYWNMKSPFIPLCSYSVQIYGYEMKDNDFILLSDTNTQPSQADLKITSVFDFTQGVYVTFLSDFPISHIQFGFYLNVPETTNLIYIYESDESETDSQKIYYNQGFWNFHKAFYYLHQKTLIYGNKQYYYEQFQLKILQNQIQATFDFNIFYAKFYHPKQKNCDPNCFLSSTDTPTKCLRCSETKELVNGACLCKNKQDIRNNYIQCSYRTIALVQPYLDSKQPILTIDFGTKIILDQNVSLSKEFCYLFIQDPDGDQDLSSLGENPQCTVDGSKFVVYLGNGATINENYQIQPLQKVFQITPETFVSIFYNSTVTQNIPDGPPILQFNYKTIESTCNDIQITLIGIQNDAGRGFQKFKWSLKSLNKSTSQSNLDQINKIIDYSNRYQTTSLIITKGLVPADSKLVIQFDYQLIIKKSGSQSLEISYQIQKALQVSFISPEQEQIYRYMSLKYQFTFTTLLCSDQGQQIFLYPIDISIYSEQLPYLNTQIQNKSIQNLDVDIRPYTLAENKISTFNVTASLNSDPSINATVIVFIKTLKTPIQVSIDGGNQNQADYKSQYQISATVVLWKYGKTLDIFDQQKSQQIVVPQTTIENAVEKEELKQDKQEQPVDEVNSRQTKRQGSYASCLNFIQQEQVQTEKQQSELKLEQCKSIEKIISNQEDNNKQETNPQIPGEQTLFNNEQANQTTSIQTNYLEKSSLKRIVLHHTLVSGASPSEANQFFSLFLISTAMTFVIVQFSLSFLKDQLIKRYSFTEQNPFLIKYMFKLFKLEDFLKSL
ncbi:hypothetical protein ABPG73_016428 [Tetrahymena malaccensis]